MRKLFVAASSVSWIDRRIGVKCVIRVVIGVVQRLNGQLGDNERFERVTYMELCRRVCS
jgi:hypothetical protein